MLAIIALLLSWASFSCSQNPVTVFHSGEEGFPCIRIPTMLVIPNTQTILAAVECREFIHDGCNPTTTNDEVTWDTQRRYICLKRSEDGGNTWGAMEKNITHIRSCNPALIWEQTHKLVLLQFNSPNETNAIIYQSMSRDLGLTWEPPVSLSAQTGMQNFKANLGTGGAGLQLENGRIVVTGYYRLENKPRRPLVSRVWYSDDHGQTYTLSSSLLQHFGEPQMLQAPNGTVMIFARNELYVHCHCPWLGLSFDNGTTFSETHVIPSIPAVACEASVAAYPEKTAIYFGNPGNPDTREHFTVHESYNNGDTWLKNDTYHPPTTTNSGAAYSAMRLLGDKLVMLWETNMTHSCEGVSCQILFYAVDAP